MKILDPRKVDRQLLSSYIKSTEYMGLQVKQNVEQYQNQQVIYHYERYYFVINDTLKIYDWTLNPYEMDKMIQYAIKFYKDEEKRVKELKKSFTLDKKSDIMTK